jgi:hypothetical protein
VPNKKICRDQIPEEEVELEAMQRGGLEENQLLLTAETAPQLDSHVFCLPILHHNQPEPNTHALLLLLFLLLLLHRKPNINQQHTPPSASQSHTPSHLAP